MEYVDIDATTGEVRSEEALAALQGAGLMVSIGVCMLFFAALLFSVMKLLDRKGRQRLKDFCKSIEVQAS